MAESAYETWKLAQESHYVWMFISALLTSFIVQRNSVINQWSPQAAPQTGVSSTWKRGFVECRDPESLQEICATIRCRTHTENSGPGPPTVACQARPILQYTEESGSPESVWVCKSLTGSSAQPGLRRGCLSQEALLCHLMMRTLVYFVMNPNSNRC